MSILTHVEAVFDYPCDAIPIVLTQVIESANPKLVSLPMGATGFEIELVHTASVPDEQGKIYTFVQRESTGQEYIVGYVYSRDELITLEPCVAEGLAAFMDEVEEDSVVMTPNGLFYLLEDNVEVINPSELRQKVIEGMPSFD